MTRPREATRKGGLRIQEAQAQLRLHDGRCQEPSRSQRSAWEGAPHLSSSACAAWIG